MRRVLLPVTHPKNIPRHIQPPYAAPINHVRSGSPADCQPLVESRRSSASRSSTNDIRDSRLETDNTECTRASLIDSSRTRENQPYRLDERGPSLGSSFSSIARRLSVTSARLSMSIIVPTIRSITSNTRSSDYHRQTDSLARAFERANWKSIYSLTLFFLFSLSLSVSIYLSFRRERSS